jgi:hypothetical protein
MACRCESGGGQRTNLCHPQTAGLAFPSGQAAGHSALLRCEFSFDSIRALQPLPIVDLKSRGRVAAGGSASRGGICDGLWQKREV